MGFYTSDRFASVSAAGTDWRDTSRKILEQLEKARTENDQFNIGFIYITDTLSEDAENIINLFRSVTRIDHWVGSVALGICGVGEEYIDEPAISAMIGRIKNEDFCVFPAVDFNMAPAQAALDNWTDGAEPMMVLVHGDPLMDTEPAAVLSGIEQMTGGFVAGGMSSSRGPHLQFAGGVMTGGISGVAFSRDVKVATTLTQGCAPIGPSHTITRCEENVVMELDGQRAFDIFAADLKTIAARRKEVVPDMPAIKEGEENNPENLFRGEVHVAFPVPGSDQKDYLVRNALGIDPDNGWIAVAHNVTNGEQMLFVHRDNNTVHADLSRALVELRQRISDSEGVFAPKGAVYISCVARTMSEFGDGSGREMALVREIIGDVPLAGFYANGEISNHRLYGYTAILILFL